MDEIKPRPKSSGLKVIKALLVFSVFCILLAILFPINPRSRQNARRSSCQSNLKQIMLGMKQYLQDHDERFPLVRVAKPTYGWADALQPYLKSTTIFQCPSEDNSPASTPPAPSQTGYTDYWFNARTAGKYNFELTDTQRTITLGDGDSGDARSHLISIPALWRKDEKSPLYRHLDGANYAFADGHVKWFKYSKWKNGLDFNSSGEPTLRLKPMK